MAYASIRTRLALSLSRSLESKAPVAPLCTRSRPRVHTAPPTAPRRAVADVSASEAHGQASARRLLRVFVGRARVGFGDSCSLPDLPLFTASSVRGHALCFPGARPPVSLHAFATIFSAPPLSTSPSSRTTPPLFHAPRPTRQPSSPSAICVDCARLDRRVLLFSLRDCDAGSAGDISARAPHGVRIRPGAEVKGALRATVSESRAKIGLGKADGTR
ncbi:hypothetical protein C8R45DRAFT_197685 [Mycena sanguinolenta]|nr:hypothetical protein C8R45DRAFT_197685 [Mycena sanguinolenta]